MDRMRGNLVTVHAEPLHIEFESDNPIHAVCVIRVDGRCPIYFRIDGADAEIGHEDSDVVKEVDGVAVKHISPYRKASVSLVCEDQCMVGVVALSPIDLY